MYSLSGALGRAEAFEPRGRLLALGRSLLAVSQLSILLTTPDSILFLRLPGAPPANGCTGLFGPTLWCVGGHSVQSMDVERGVAVAILIAVATGYRPAWLCIPHWYVAFSPRPFG